MTHEHEHDSENDHETGGASLDDEGLRVLVAGLARPHRSGGRVIERASLLASGADFRAAIAWIEAHGGKPEQREAARPRGGVHSPRLADIAAGDQTPLRFVLPADALS